MPRPPKVLVIVATTNEDEPFQHASWLVGSYAEPEGRAPTLTVQLGTLDAAAQADVLAVAPGDRITVTGLPAQAEASSAAYFVEGYTESINPGSHAVTFNVTPATTWDNVWVLGTSTLGDETRLAF